MGVVSEGTRTWRGKDQAERTAERRQRLFDATLDLIESHGIGGVTVRGVCATSGLTARYFYESFSDLPELLLALYDDLATRAVTAVAEGVKAAVRSPEDPLRSFVAAGMTLVSTQPRTCRFLLVDAAGHPEMNRRRRLLISELTDRATRIWTAEVKNTPELVSSGLAVRFALGGLIEFATAYLEGDLGLTEPECAEAALGLIRAFVTTEGELHDS